MDPASEAKQDFSKIPDPANPKEPLWTVDDLAEYMKRSRRWVYGALSRDPASPGSLPHVRIPGGAARFVPDVIRRWIELGCPPAADLGKA
jgi:hypothetical protein